MIAMATLRHSPNRHDIATVILSHTLAPSNLERFKTYQEELNQRVKTFDGFFGTESFPPEEGTQEEWVVIYRFHDIHQLKFWLASPERQEISEKIDQLIEKECHVQILVEPQENRSVTAVYAHRIKDGCETQFRSWRTRMLNAQKNFDGFLGVDSYDPCKGLTRDWVDVARFSDSEKLDAWIKSAERKRLLDELQPILEDLTVKRVSSGLDAWFSRGVSGEEARQTPPAWKQAMSVWLGLYPTVMLLTYYFNPLFGNLSLPWMMLIGNAASVALLTWFVMIWINKLLSFWLAPKTPSVRLDIAGAVGILVILVGMGFLFEAIPPFH